MVTNRLREETKEAHQSLEKHVVMTLKNIRSNEDYIAMLQKFYSYFSNLEKHIAAYITPEVLPDYTDRRNSAYLKRDIIELGGDTIERTVDVPVINNVYQALGALYVMEGSIMGGKVIVQILEKHGISKGLSFFSGYGENTMPMWGVFTETLNRLAGNEEEQDLMVTAASNTFSCFEKLFINQVAGIVA